MQEACSSFPGLEDKVLVIKRKCLNLPTGEEQEANTKVCCYGILQMWLSKARLPLKTSYSFNSLMFYFRSFKSFCLTNSRENQFSVQLPAEDEKANSDQFEGILLAMQLRL